MRHLPHHNSRQPWSARKVTTMRCERYTWRDDHAYGLHWWPASPTPPESVSGHCKIPACVMPAWRQLHSTAARVRRVQRKFNQENFLALRAATCSAAKGHQIASIMEGSAQPPQGGVPADAEFSFPALPAPATSSSGRVRCFVHGVCDFVGVAWVTAARRESCRAGAPHGTLNGDGRQQQPNSTAKGGHE